MYVCVRMCTYVVRILYVCAHINTSKYLLFVRYCWFSWSKYLTCVWLVFSSNPENPVKTMAYVCVRMCTNMVRICTYVNVSGTYLYVFIDVWYMVRIRMNLVCMLYESSMYLVRILYVCCLNPVQIQYKFCSYLV